MKNNIQQFKIGELVPDPRPEREILATWKGGIDRPLVSISTITYNHEHYIKDALNGLLMQETVFPFEILIHDDASTDTTADIIREYEKGYPNILKPIYQTENQYSKGGGISRIYQYPRAMGKYIAFCEGDDYWIDPLKIQKQVEFLENNPDYGVLHSDYHDYIQDDKEWHFNIQKNNKFLVNTKNLNSKDLFRALIDGTYRVATASVMFRKDLLSLRIPDTEKFLMGDTPMWLDFSQHTKFKYIEEPLSLYRILPNSASRSSSQKKQRRFFLSMIEMRIYYLNKHNYPVTDEIKFQYNKDLFYYKVYDPSYIQRHELFNPNKIQKIVFRFINSDIYKFLILKNIFTIKLFDKFIVRKFCY